MKIISVMFSYRIYFIDNSVDNCRPYLIMKKKNSILWTIWNYLHRVVKKTTMIDDDVVL